MMIKKSINMDCLTKVEGHAKLVVEMDGEKVKTARIHVYEPSRYFETMVIGKKYDIVPTISQRICGICSVIHTVTSIKAIENAIGFKPSRETIDLRKLLLYSSIVHSHAAHLFFFAAPDYLGLDDVIEMAKKKREYLELAIETQKIASNIVKNIGGRAIHPVTPKVGYFTSVPDKKKILGMISEFEKLKKLSVKTAKLFESFRLPKFDNETQYMGITDNKTYTLYEGDVSCLGKESFKPEEYNKFLNEEVFFDSTAKYSSFKGKPYLVGSLSRLNLNHRFLSKDAKSILKSSGIKLPSYSTFLNNFAQGIEMVHFCDAAIELLKKYKETGMTYKKPDIKAKSGGGVAICEAPRGMLIHHYKFDKEGKATYANIMTPTCQNVKNIEFDISKYLPGVHKLPDKKIKRELEMLIRAYDPCFSCSTHFLELDLKR